MTTYGTVGFEPDFTRDAASERARLWHKIHGAERAGYTNLAEALREADSELFDVSDRAATKVTWRDR